MLALLRILSRIPLSVLYALSTVLYLILRYLYPYRRAVIEKNIQIAFPKYTRKQVDALRFAFYRWFAEFTVETLKLYTAPLTQIRAMMSVELPPSLVQHSKDGQSVITLLGHYGQWEYFNASGPFAHLFSARPVYSPLKNKVADDFAIAIRTRSGAEVLKRSDTAREIIKMLRNKTLFSLGLLADQSATARQATKARFFGVETSFFSGPGKLAEKFNMPVYFVRMQRVKRGQYKSSLELLVDKDSGRTGQEIVQLFATVLEEQIKETPYLWLWSHNRWKRDIPAVTSA